MGAVRRGGPGRWVAVAGEPGIGKTRILEELGREPGWRVVAGRATEFEATLPFALFADALGSYELLEPGLGAERYRLHRDVWAALARLADAGPLLLVLDDVHWADPASFELVAHLIRRPVARMLMVLAYR